MEENIDLNQEVRTENSDNVNNASELSAGEKSESKKINNNLDEKVNYQNPENINKELDNKINFEKETIAPVKNTEIKPKKEIPIEKKPFSEFVDVHLIPSLIEEFNKRGFEIEDVNLKNTFRPIAGDKCWVIYCKVKDTCNFWLSFEKEDISSSKSISLSKPYQSPSIIESFLIDEKRITLQLIISRILQRLNGQKLIGVN